MSPENEVLLASLEAQGAEFLKSFTDLSSKRKRDDKDQEDIPLSRNMRPRVDSEPEVDSEEEWSGFGSDDDCGTNQPDPPVPDSKDIHDGRKPHVVVFSDGTLTSRTPSTSKAQARAFMSSKVSKLKEVPVDSKTNARDDESLEQEVSNVHNDALLHRLVHTKLLSGSLNPELNMTPAQRRKALAGRVLELAGDSKLGKGEGVVRQEEKQKASKRIRDGMMAKQKERDVKSLDEAKNVGNYHPALKKLFAASGSEAQSRKRDRGLKMGIGRFSGGMLKLSPEEIDSVQNVRSTRGRGRGRGGGGGRGRGDGVRGRGGGNRGKGGKH